MVFETYDMESFSPYVSQRFPNDYDYTRITEFKKMTGQVINKTTILKEYPCDDGEPFYPFPSDQWTCIARKYLDDASREKRVIFLGRLAEYRYYDMDDVIRKALDIFEKIRIEYAHTSHK
jgi:UDP-galactopyranose mutase